MAKSLKLHELLAVETNLRGQADKVQADLRNTFEKKRHLFAAKVCTFHSTTEGVAPVVEEQSSIQSTVRKELEWVSGPVSKAINAAVRIAQTNTVAKADVVLEDSDEALLKDVPATALMDLSKRLIALKALVDSVPTLDPAKGFQIDPQSPPGIWKAAAVTGKHRTKKVQKPLVLSPATDKHPAQVQLISEDVAVGALDEAEWSGMITPAQKAAMLDRVERLTRAIKGALARANETEVAGPDQLVGNKLLAYIFQER